MTDTRDSYAEYIMSLYDEYVRDAGREVKSAEAMAAIRPQVVDMLAQQPRNLDAEADMLIRSHVTRKRDARRSALKRDLEALLDGAFGEDGIYVDPIMERSYGLGRADGADKTLRLWTVDDFRELARTHFRVAAEQTASAAEMDAVVERVVDRMQVAGALTVGDVHWSHD